MYSKNKRIRFALPILLEGTVDEESSWKCAVSTGTVLYNFGVTQPHFFTRQCSEVWLAVWSWMLFGRHAHHCKTDEEKWNLAFCYTVHFCPCNWFPVFKEGTIRGNGNCDCTCTSEPLWEVYFKFGIFLTSTPVALPRSRLEINSSLWLIAVKSKDLNSSV